MDGPSAARPPGIRNKVLAPLRGLIDRIEIAPEADGPAIELVGEIVAMVELGREAERGQTSAALGGGAAGSGG